MIWLSLFIAPAFAKVLAEPIRPTKKILIIAADSQGSGAAISNATIQSALKGDPDYRVEIFSESLEDRRLSTESFEAELVTLLQHKYEDQKPDLIFALGAHSLEFLSEHESVLFPDVPKVYMVPESSLIANMDLGRHTTGVTGRVELGPTVDIMLAQNPGTKKIWVITGESEVDSRLLGQAKREFAAFAGRVEFAYPQHQSAEQLQNMVAALPRDNLVYYLWLGRDATGRGFTNQEGVALIASASSVPVYATTDSSVGFGALGGDVLSHKQLAETASQIGLRIIRGEDPAAIPPVVVPNVKMFDWRELQKWGIDEDRLPYGSVVEHRVIPVWELYRGYVAAAAAILILQSMMIVSFFVMRSRRWRAELERKEFKSLAAAEHKRLEEVVANVPGIVWESRVVNATGARRTSFVSAYVEEMLGYTVEECLADPEFIVSKIVEGDRELFRNAANLAFHSDEQQTVRFRCVTKDGNWIWAQSQMVAVRDDNGTPVGLRGVTMDVTARKNAEQEAATKERQLVEAQRLAQIGSWEWDEETDTVTWSDEIYRIVGVDPSSPPVSYADHGKLYKPESWRRLQAAVGASLEKLEPYYLELELANEGSDQPWVCARGELVNENGKKILRGTLQNITIRKQAEEALRDSEARFRSIADTAPMMIFIMDAEMNSTFFNQYVFDFTGLTYEKLAGNAWLQIVHEDDRQKWIDRFAEAGAEQKPFTIEFRAYRTDGTVRWLYHNGVPRFAADGEFIGYIGTGVDITERRGSEESLVAALDQISELKNELYAENIQLKEMMKLDHGFNEIVGTSDALKYVLFKIEQVAPTDATVLITGETGTGKELVARAIHGTSLRRDKPMIKVNCAALSITLIESELFGHERGAFTGANSRKVGRFELADGATIFLDEIGELPLESQAKLLRLIQEGEFERLGSSRTIKADVRIVAATNRNLEDEVRNGRFREDLLFRLNVFPVTVPPLRDRKEDIPALVEHFATKFSRKLGKQIHSIGPSAMRSLVEHSWPGNIRELANAIERAVITTSGETLQIRDIVAVERTNGEPAIAEQTLESIERRHIMQTLINTSWRIDGPNGAARILGLNPSTLRTRINKLGISKNVSSIL